MKTPKYTLEDEKEWRKNLKESIMDHRLEKRRDTFILFSLKQRNSGPEYFSVFKIITKGSSDYMAAGTVYVGARNEDLALKCYRSDKFLSSYLGEAKECKVVPALFSLTSTIFYL